MHAAVLSVHDGTGPLPFSLRRSVMLLGSFDGLHRGHMALVQAGRAAAGGKPLSVLQCDPHPRLFFSGARNFRLSGGVAQQHLLASAGVGLIYAPRFDAAFAATAAEDFVTAHLAARLDVSAVVVGRDFRFGRGRSGDVALLERMGRDLGFGVICLADECEGGQRISSSRIRADIGAGRIARAVRLMGHPWLLPVAVVAGGWEFPDDQLLPPDGNYPVERFDATGRPLGAALMTISGRKAQMAAAPGVAMIALDRLRDTEWKG